jgi:predicted Holliday junction resolvase-like endonuclease
MQILLIGILVSISIFLLIKFVRTKRLYEEKQIEYKKLLSQKKKSEIVTGFVAEKLAPFLSDFKHDPQSLKFLGDPIDYVCFENDKVIFIEIKSANSPLTVKQRKIKKLIKDNKVEWEEYRIK